MIPRKLSAVNTIKKKPSESFVTVDDCIVAAAELLERLTKLAEYKHPLDVRKGSALPTETPQEPASHAGPSTHGPLRAGSRTYFFDVETAKGRPYLKITESRFTGQGKERRRTSILIFPEHAQEFAARVTELATRLRRSG